jgi:predicted hydrocarbon binding protein
MLAETQCTLREADSTLCERKAAHHAACVEALAGEDSEVDGTKCWSRQDCTVFRKELDWELQAFSKAKLSLSCSSCRQMRDKQPICERKK